MRGFGVHLALALTVALACGDPRQDETRISEGVTKAPPAPGSQMPAFAPSEDVPLPRTRLTAALLPLWESAPTDTDSMLLDPRDAMFSRFGLLVFDAADRTVQAFEAGTGRVLGRIGREGAGPGEFSNRMWFQGTYDDPALYDAVGRRLARVLALTSPPETESMPRDRSWISSCALRHRRTVAVIAADSGAELFLLGKEGIADSLSFPWTHLATEHALARQAIVKQLDDSTCAALTVYQSEFGLLSEDFSLRAGTYIERSAPVSVVRTDHATGRGYTISLPRGTRSGPYDAASVGDDIIVLFGGRSSLSRRLLDVYARSDLRYKGTLVLPFKGTSIAARGDTIAILGEREDYPFLALYRLVPR